MLDEVPSETVEAARRVYRKQVSINALPAKQRQQVEAHPWESYAEVALLRRMDSHAAAAERYPDHDRAIRPTRLGNMLRSYEDPIEEQIGRPIEGFVQDIFHLLPAQTQGDHDHFRSRLDLYCSLVIVFLVGGLGTSALLLDVDDRSALAAVLTGIVLSWLSYRAAVTSARAYGSFLTSLTQFTPDGAPTSP